jgi:hypothetical protein
MFNGLDRESNDYPLADPEQPSDHLVPAVKVPYTASATDDTKKSIGIRDIPNHMAQQWLGEGSSFPSGAWDHTSVDSLLLGEDMNFNINKVENVGP